MVQPRMLYPMLSVPFVWLFGLHTGMIVVPMLAIGTAVFACARLVQRLHGPLAALAAAGVLASTSAVIAFTEALTDPLAIGVIALILLNLPIGRRPQGHNLVFLGLLSVMLCLTRQVMPMAAGMAVGGWLWAVFFPGGGRPRRVRNEWLAPSAIVAGVTVGGQVVGSILAPYNITQQFLYASDKPTLGSALSNLPMLAWQMTRAEIVSMLQGDRYLLFLMAAPFVYMLIRFKDPTVGLFLGGLVGTYALILANGIPSGMRYESIIFPVATLALGALVQRFLPVGLRGENSTLTATWWQGGRRRVPSLAAASTLAVAGIVGWSATHGSASMVGAVPTAPADAAALVGTGHQLKPAAADPAEQILRGGLVEAVKIVRGPSSALAMYADWRHPLRYRPTGPADPGWNVRGADGTAVVRFGDFAHPQIWRFGSALSLQGKADPDSIRVLTRRRGVYGEDVTFEVADQAGRVHHGRATVLYPVRAHASGLITELVYEP
jgi:hypothetical protein